MSAEASRNGRSAPATETCVVVRVEDAIDPALTGRAGAVYESPPQPREQAIALARLLLLGHPVDALDGTTRWSCPLAGGRRTVTIRDES